MFNRTERILFAAAAIYSAVLLSACSAIDTHTAPPKDWPKLEVTERKVGFWEMQSLCGGGGAMTLLKQYMACAWIRFDNMTCTIYYAADDEYGALAVEHEREHCAGRDHIGASTLRDGWDKYKQTNKTQR